MILYQQKHAQKPNYCYPNQATTERWSTIEGHLKVTRKIFNQTKIAWIQVIFGNTLLYPVSLSNCPGPERGVLCISIVDIISRSTLVVFSLLRAINYHYNKGPLKVEFFKYKMIYRRLLRIYVLLLQPIFLHWVINIVLIFIIARYTCRGTFSAIVHWPTTIILFLLCFILNCHGTFIFSQITSLFFCGIFEHNFFAADKEIHKLWFSIKKQA